MQWDVLSNLTHYAYKDEKYFNKMICNGRKEYYTEIDKDIDVFDDPERDLIILTRTIREANTGNVTYHFSEIPVYVAVKGSTRIEATRDRTINALKDFYKEIKIVNDQIEIYEKNYYLSIISPPFPYVIYP